MLEQAELLALFARRQRVEAVLAGPLGARAFPAEARHDHVPARVELNPLGLKQLALERAARADATLTVDHPLPRHAVAALGRQLVQGVAHRARVAAAADDRRDVAVGRD